MINLARDYKLFLRFFHYLKPNLRLAALAAAMIPFTIGAALLTPWLIMKVVDVCFIGGQGEKLPGMIAMMLLAVLAGYAADCIYTLSLQRAGQLAIYSMRRDLFLHVMRLPRRFFDVNPAGSTLTRLTSDFEALGDTMAVGILSLFTDLLKITALIVFLAFISPVLTLILAAICIPSAFLTRWLHRKMRALYRKSWGALSNSTAFLQECLKGAASIQLYNAEERVLQRYRAKNELFYRSQKYANISESLLSTMVEGLITFAAASILWAGGFGIAAGTLSLGAVIAFINTVPRVFVPIRDFTFQLATMQRAFAALEHIEELFIQEPERESLRDMRDGEGLETFESIEFERVTFRYSPQGPEVLKDVSFKLRRGERIAIVGPTGSGKSTIVKLLTRAYGPYEGSIRINGRELSGIPRRRLRKLISLMSQDSYLFNGTAAFNIALDRPGISTETIERSARYVHADSFIKGLPGGYDFMISEHGGNLSAGQGQLLCFARSIASESEVIILDEATSSVDSMTERLIEMAVSHVFEEKTVIAIAHRLSTIRSADLILVIEDGSVIERGTHPELMNLNGLYARLVRNMADGVIADGSQKHAHGGSLPL